MQFAFQKFAFSLSFLEPVFADTNPLFILRSMMGKKSSFDVLASPDTKEELIDKNSGGVELRTFF